MKTYHESPINLPHERNLLGIALARSTRVVSHSGMLVRTKLRLVVNVRHNGRLLVGRFDRVLGFSISHCM